MTTTIHPAASIHTFDPSRPTADAVAVRNGRFLAVGSVDELLRIDGATIDGSLERFTLIPGLVEAHCHAMAGGMWHHTYCGYYDRRGPDGTMWPGCTTIAEVIDRLRDAEAGLPTAADPDEPLLAWGLDPIYFTGERLVAEHLDRVSTTRPIFVFHASGHLATVNTALMATEGINADTDVDGVPKDGRGDPIGELQEPAAMALAGRVFRRMFADIRTHESLWNFGSEARNTGTTTLTDLGNQQSTDAAEVARYQQVFDHDDFPARVSVFHMPAPGTPDTLAEAAAAVTANRDNSSDKLRFGHVKLIIDGSIQGYTARLRWPGYVNGAPNGLWLLPPEQVIDVLRPYHRAGLLIHAHCNGDEAVDVFLDAVEGLLGETPRVDHRHTVQHCQLTAPDQYRRIAALGMCANLFSNHTWYWGDQHAASTVGPDRAGRMNSARTALDLGVPLSMHSDAPITPLGGLHVAWAAVNRLTATGNVLGPDERISVDEALRAVTVGAAHQLKMDDEVGSISPHKFADLAILEADPFAVDPVELRDVPVWGTMLGGRTFQAG